MMMAFRIQKQAFFVSFFLIIGVIFGFSAIATAENADEAIYHRLSQHARQNSGPTFFKELTSEARTLDWRNAEEKTFQGNLRYITTTSGFDDIKEATIYLVRTVKGELFILTTPEDPTALEKGADSYYANLKGMLSAKMRYRVLTRSARIGGETYNFVKLTAVPEISPLDRIFRIAIVVVLFAVMLGMGMTLTTADFRSVLKEPLGIFIGLFCLFGLMPLIAFGLGHLFGYVQAYPFIYIGMILVTATPGGATSNLMTHLAKGDVALSISLTAIATGLSLIVTPAILLLYCSNLPQVEMPVKLVVLPIFVLVLLPLVIGMIIKARAETFTEKAAPVFNAIGVLAVLICILGGLAGNPEMLSDSMEKFGLTGFMVVVLLAALGMIIGGIVPKLISISNYQARAISMEIGIRNAILGMTIALLIQDRVGDFDSHMFAVSGLFAIVMYITGAISIFAQKKLLPVSKNEETETQAFEPAA